MVQEEFVDDLVSSQGSIPKGDGKDMARESEPDVESVGEQVGTGQ